MIDINLNYVNYMQSVDENAASQGVESILAQIETVDYCAVLVWKNRLLVGVIPKPLFSRSERTQLEQQITLAVGEVYGFDEVLISFDMDVIHEINKLNKISADSKQIETLFYSVKVRRE
ncbi:MAG: YhcN/YlaJ family sporulation lipoprotein [Clostridia bacterium]|nr:YhcN/YlaJ family sporulation lipoprotein [Clostridia bacterium]MDE7328392.1 YhcN/YlaJ family sporulation lipoprotein [Clostridia bacterium]